MKSKNLAIFGIGTYVFSVLASATNLEGDSIVPSSFVLLSGLLDISFVVLGVWRLWKLFKNVAVTLVLSDAILLALSIASEFISGNSVILLLNAAKIFNLVAFFWAISILWVMEKNKRYRL